MIDRRRVVVDVPVRVCDVGGWTDTWFAGRGLVCSLAVGPGVTVTATVTDGDGDVVVDAPDLGARFSLADVPPEHRLLAESVGEAGGAVAGQDVEVQVASSVPPGSSLGTSAAVCVGVIAALDALHRGAIRPPADLATAAHCVEADRVGRQSGVQDQLAAAHGGANRIEVDYPHATVTPIELTPDVRAALDARLLHVAYGGGHDSSAVHRQVIAELEAEGPGSAQLQRLTDLASAAVEALASGDLPAWGLVLSAATEAQRALHPQLISLDAQEIIDLAAADGALGWKVNGAGGTAGSLSVLCQDGEARRRLEEHVRVAGHRPLDLRLRTAGARVR